MAVTLRTLLEIYKRQNPHFRHEYNGESWNIWTLRDNNTGGYPDFADIGTPELEQLLIGMLMDQARSLRYDAKSQIDTANQIDKVLSDYKDKR